MKTVIALSISFVLIISGSSIAQVSIETIDYFLNLYKAISGEYQPAQTIGKSSAPKCGTPVTVALHSLKKFSDDPLLLSALQRPDSLPLALESDHFMVHYITTGNDAPYQVGVDTNPADGIPDYINRVSEVFEYAHEIETDPAELGFRTPPSDNGLGGNDKYDIYVINLGTGYYGFTNPEEEIDGNKAYSYIEIENDFAGSTYETNPLDGLRVTAAHEYFHAIQFGYDAYEFDFTDPNNPATYKPWWLEASSTWMEDMVFDEINDYLNYLPFFYDNPWMGLGTFSYDYFGNRDRAFHPYASCVWPIYLTERFGNSHHINIMRQIWEICDNPPNGGYNTLPATESVLAQFDTTLSDAFLEFSVWNYFTGQRFNPSQFYSEGDSFPMLDPTASIVNLDTIPIPIGQTNFPPEHLGANYIIIDTRTSPDTGGVAINFDGEDLLNAGWYVAVLGDRQTDSRWRNIFVNPATGFGYGERGSWGLFDSVVVIPTVSGLLPFYNDYTYTGNVFYDPSLVGDTSDAVNTIELNIAAAYPSPFVISDTSQVMFVDFAMNPGSYPSDFGLNLYDSGGNLVRKIRFTEEGFSLRGYGEYTYQFDGKNSNGEYLASGIYILMLHSNGHSSSKKIAVINHSD